LHCVFTMHVLKSMIQLMKILILGHVEEYYRSNLKDYAFD